MSPPPKPPQYEAEQTETFHSHEADQERWVGATKKTVRFFFENEPRDAFVYDLGCGDGVALSEMARMGFDHLSGSDLSQRKLLRAMDACPGVPLEQCDAHELWLTPETVDIVYCSHMLEHCYDPLEVLDRIRAGLRMSGRLFLVLPFPDHDGHHAAHCGSGVLRLRDGSFDDVLDVVRSAGFEVVEAKTDHECQAEIWIRARRRV